MGKPILALDFDGVVHSYDKGWQSGEIYGEVTPGFFAWLREAVQHFDVQIYSSRSDTEVGRERMREWLEWQARSYGAQAVLLNAVKFPVHKPKAFVGIDDRVLTFQGSWTDPELSPVVLRDFKPWNQRT